MSNRDSGCWERFAAIAGGTAYRQPLGGVSALSGQVPFVHELCAAISMARRGGKRDLGPEILFDLVTEAPRNKPSVVARLAAAIGRELGVGTHAVVVEAATEAYERVIAGGADSELAAEESVLLSNVGVAVLMDSARVTARRAARCLAEE